MKWRTREHSHWSQPFHGRRRQPAAALPTEWRLEGNELVWTSDVPLRMGGARHEMRSGERLLGYRRAARRYAAPAPAGRRVVGKPFRLGRRPSPRRAMQAYPAAHGAGRASRRTRHRAGNRRSRDARLLTNASPEIRAAGTFAPGLPGANRGAGRSHDAHRARRPPCRSCCSCTAATARAIAAGRTVKLSGDWPCLPGWRPVPSHTGYRYITDVLASQGLPHGLHIRERHQWPGRDVRGRRLLRALRARAAPPGAMGRMVRPRRRPLGRALPGPSQPRRGRSRRAQPRWGRVSSARRSIPTRTIPGRSRAWF